MKIKDVTAKKNIAEWLTIVENKIQYCEKQFNVVINTYLTSAKRQDRENAIRYKAKIEVLKELLR